MKSFSGIITFSKNKRGIYDLDTSKGCSSGTKYNKNGCYDSCYAAKYSKIRGYDFSKTVFRKFKNINHKINIINQINSKDVEFIRIGVSGDPSENWEHTLDIIEQINDWNLFDLNFIEKDIVIITKHWNNLSLSQLNRISKQNITINTSVSALDSKSKLLNRIKQYELLKCYCNSVLRIVSCDFNTNNKAGKKLNEIQKSLFKYDNIIDNALRVYNNNIYVRNGIINFENKDFMKGISNISMHDNDIFIGTCDNCNDKCGLKYKQ